MFATRDVWMVFKAAKLAVVKDDKGVDHRVAECQLVLDPFPLTLAHELGEDVALHCYTKAGALRPELSSITLDPRVPHQRMTVRGAKDTAGREIRDVEILDFEEMEGALAAADKRWRFPWKVIVARA